MRDRAGLAAGHRSDDAIGRGLPGQSRARSCRAGPGRRDEPRGGRLAQLAADYLRDVREEAAIYATEGIAHPGMLLRQCNMALRDNVVLPPWVHTGSRMQSFATGRVGDRLSVRARVVANYERKGHRLVDLDCLVLANGEKVLAQVIHTAVYRLRHLAAA